MTQPRRPDEIALYARLRASCGSYAAVRRAQQPGIRAVEDAFGALRIPSNRGYYLLDKWTRKGWWDYGVSLRSGWFTETAPEALEP